MLLVYKNILKILPIVRFEVYNKESSFFIQTNLLIETLTILKYHFKYQYKLLVSISGVDNTENFFRFQIVYELLSIKFNSRLRLKVLVNELKPVSSVEHIFKGASWWECEIWDMFGIFFIEKKNLTRLLCDYGFIGYPLRKDFPLSGFNESRFNSIKNRVIYENIELSQEYRIFEFMSPWEKFKIKK